MQGPFPVLTSNVFLFALHDLNRRDKHRPGLVPVAVPGNSFVSRITFWQGLPFQIGSAQGKHFVGPAGNYRPEDLTKGEKPQADYHVGPGQFEFSRAPLGRGEVVEFMVTTPNAIVETDFRPSFDFVFDEPGLQQISATSAL